MGARTQKGGGPNSGGPERVEEGVAGPMEARRGGGRKGGGRTQKSGGPKGGAPERVGGRGCGPDGGPKGVGAEGVGAEGVGAEGWGAENFALFLLSPTGNFIRCSLFGGFSRGILVVFEAPGRSNVRVWSSLVVV